MRFAHPIFFLLTLSLPLLALRYFHPRFKASLPSLQFSVVARARRAACLAGGSWVWLPPWLRLTAVFLFVVAAARPQLVSTEQKLRGEGIDIVLALDISGSMEAADFQPKNRLNVAIEVMERFIEGRVGDRIGLVVFAGKSFTQCPLTLDYRVLTELLQQVDPKLSSQDGTAIGMGLANSLNRLKDSDASSRVVILVTDGRNNVGKIDPVTAAQMASSLGIRVYTIGVGKDRYPPVLVQDWTGRKRYVRSDVPMEPDEELLKKIAKKTGGRFYRATDRQKFQAIFDEIDALERTEFEYEVYAQYEELMKWPLGLGVILLMIELLLSHGRYRVLP